MFRSRVRYAVCVMLVVALLAAFGCTKTTKGSSGGTLPGSADSTSAATTTSQGQAPEIDGSDDATSAVGSEGEMSGGPNSTSASGALPKNNDTAIQESMDLGGLPQQGETLNLVLATTAPTYLEAQKALVKAQPKFGDMQSYLIVERSDHFSGMAPGKWVVIEAFREKKNAQTQGITLIKRAFPNASIKQVKVLCDDPIPVYEDMVPG